MATMEACVLEAASRFGITLKDKQFHAILTFLSGKDVFISLPTGYGKSLIYALLPTTFDLHKGKEGSIVVCVSPLVALMIDQKTKYVMKGIKAEFVGEDQTDHSCITSVLNGDVQLLYISPECLICNAMYRNMLLSPIYKEKLVALVVDEAHCVKTWGDSFRIAYAHLGDIRSILPPHVNVMALTATATTDTYQTVCQRLSLTDPILIGAPPNRGNIVYEVKPLIPMIEYCSGLAIGLKELGIKYPKTIIFFQRYTDCAALYQVLKRQLGPYITLPPDYPIVKEFMMVSMYTRASKSDMKEKVLSAFTNTEGKLRVVLATTAFGMGIDCSDIRVIVHWGPPSNCEQYVQESGRAGRDNLHAKAIIYYGNPGKFVDQDIKDYANNSTQCSYFMIQQLVLVTNSIAVMYVIQVNHNN